MNGITVIARFQQDTRRPFLVTSCCTQVNLAANTALFIKQGFAWNAVVNHIDHTTNGTAAILQRTWPTQYFDAFNADGIRRDGMVVAQVGCIQQGTTIVQNADAVTVLPANNRAAGVRAKVGAADTGCAVECFTECGFGSQQQAFT